MMQAPLTKEEVARRFAQAPPREAGVPTGPSDVQWAYREAAAVLAWFETDWIRPHGSIPEDEPGAIARLLADSAALGVRTRRPRWALRSDVRRETLRRLGSTSAMLAALEANPDRPLDAGQRLLEAAIRGDLPPLGQQNIEELEATLQAVNWLGEIVSPLPTPEEVRGQLDRARLLKPFHWLVGDDFCGRQRELDRLREYVGVLPARQVAQALVRGVREFFSLVEQPPLVLHGPGGIGKSTLLAKFLLEHLEAGEESRFPFTYVDFDRSDMTAQEPVTLLVEAARQLGIQYPAVRERAVKVRQHWLAQLGRLQAGARPPAGSYHPTKSPPPSLQNRGPLLDDLGKLLAEIGEREKPYLLVLDTFEVVQSRSSEWVAELWDMLNGLQARYPRLRTVISGRAPIRAFQTQDLALGDLDREGAECLLRTHGVSEPDLVRRLARQVGGNPLSLELAAEIVSREGAASEGIRGLGSWKRLWLQVQERGIHGYLYRRLLDHIVDDDVRRLAHPGLVLRRITPALIRDVLAGPCGVEVRDDARAQELFDRLQQEVTLVSLEEDGSLRHRPDVRSIMLEALMQDEPLKVRQIHERAAAYYHNQSGVPARAEEIYHRLFLDRDFGRVDALWEAGVEAHLQGAIDEVPQRARPYLASRLGVTREGLSWDRLKTEAWERLAGEQVRTLTRFGRWDEALEVLAQREERSEHSPLYLLEGQILVGLGHWAEARRVVKDGLYWAAEGDEPALLLDMLRLAARIEEQQGGVARAREMLAQAWDLVTAEDALETSESRNPAVLRLEIAVNRLRLARLAPRLPQQEILVLQEAAVKLLEPEVSVLPQLDWPLLRSVLRELGATYPELLTEALHFGQAWALEPDQRLAVAEALAAWDATVSSELGEQAGVLARAIDLDVSGTLDETWSGFLEKADTPYLARALGRLLDKFEVPEEVARVLVENLLSEEGAEIKSAL